MSQTILVVGGAGYIGSHTNLVLLEKGYKTIIFDNLSKGHREVVPENCELVIGDLLNLIDLESLFKNYKIDGIIHFAANIEVGESQLDPEKYYVNNVVGSLNLFNTARKFGVNNIVFSSTAAVYGIPESPAPLLETSPTKPINTYGRTKLIVENILSDYARSYNLKSICLRYFNACGADLQARTGENHNPESHLIPLVLASLKSENSELKIFGNDYQTPDGTCIRDYVHVLDLANAHILALEALINDKLQHEAINLGSGKGFSVLEVINTISQVTNINPRYEIHTRREGDPDFLTADNTKARELLGWQTEFSDLQTIIKSAWQWYQQKFLS